MTIIACRHYHQVGGSTRGLSGGGDERIHTFINRFSTSHHETALLTGAYGIVVEWIPIIVGFRI